MAVSVDPFRLGEAILGDAARHHVMTVIRAVAIIGTFRIAVVAGIAEKTDAAASVQARMICFMTNLSF
jgi:hypothetical protein